MLRVDPLISPTAWLTLAALAAGMLAWYGLRRPGNVSRARWAAILGLMTVAVALVLAVLLNPTWVTELPTPAGRPLVTLLVDGSGSMATTDGPAGRTRYDSAVTLAEAAEKTLRTDAEVRVVRFSEAAAPVSAAELAKKGPSGNATDIASALSGVMQADRPQGQAVVLLSDGIQTAEGGAPLVRSTARAAHVLDVPIYTACFGGAGGGRDLSVELLNPQELLFVGQQVLVRALVRSRGVPGGEATVQLRYEGQTISQQTVPLNAAGLAVAKFEVSRDQVGLYSYEVRVNPLPNEMTDVNNSATLLVRVIDQPLRVLLVEGKPYWDAKFFVRTLALDPSVELHAQVKVAPGRVMQRVLTKERTPSATAPAGTQPARNSYRDAWRVIPNATETLGNLEELRKYQIVVLGREAEDFLTDAAVANLQSWVSRDGGALICYRGAPMAQVNQRMARLLPVRWSAGREVRFHPRLTEEGQDLNWFAGAEESGQAFLGLPSLATSTQVEHIKPLTLVLATAPGGGGAAAAGGGDVPVVTYQPYGAGRCVTVEGAGMWRWAFTAPEYQDHDDLYGALWHGLFRWLVSATGLPPGQQIALRSDKVSFSVTETPTLTLLVRPELVGRQDFTIDLRPETGGEAKAVPAVPSGDDPGTYRVAPGRLPEGRYVARIKDPPGGGEVQAKFDVRRMGEEQLNLTARPDLLAQVAEESGGQVLAGQGVADQIGRAFKAHLERAHPTRVLRLSAWDRWAILLAVFALWTVSWAVRRYSGLV